MKFAKRLLAFVISLVMVLQVFSIDFIRYVHGVDNDIPRMVGFGYEDETADADAAADDLHDKAAMLDATILNESEPEIIFNALEADFLFDALATDVLHTVTFKYQDIILDRVRVLDGEFCAVPPPPNSAADGFLGWFADCETAVSPFDFIGTPITGDITLYARFSDAVLVTYLTAPPPDGAVHETVSLHRNYPVNGPTSSPIPPAGCYLSYWYDVAGDDDIPFEFGRSVDPAVGSTLTLAPFFTAECYVLFISSGTQANPQLQAVEMGNTVIRPLDPTRAGFVFSHWSRQENGAVPYDFSAPVAEDFSLFAVWTPTLVDYRVVYWVERPNFSGDPGTEPGNYVFNKYETKSATAGSIADYTNGIGLDRMTVTVGNRSIQYARFSHGESRTVDGRGTTVINVYFKRIAYTYEFDLNPGANSTTARRGATMTFGGSAFSQGVNPGGVSLANTRYSFTAKFEQDIEHLWPSSANATIARTQATRTNTSTTNWTNVTTNNGFASWTPSGTSSTSGLVSKRFTVNADLLPINGTVVTLIANWGNVTLRQANYWIERLPNESGGEQRNFSPVGNRWYVRSTEHSQSISLAGSLSAKGIEGTTHVGTVNQNAQGQTITSGTVQTFNFYYTRGRFTLSFNTQGGGIVAPVGELMFGQTISNHIPETLPARTVDGNTYTFDGWYYDADYFRPVSDEAMMPNGNLQLFAKWDAPGATIAYYDNGVYIGEKKIKYGDYLNEEDAPAPYHEYKAGTIVAGREFVGWFWFVGTEASRQLIPFRYDMPIVGDIELHAVWRAPAFRISYYIGYGSGTAPVDDRLYTLGTTARLWGSADDQGNVFSPPAEQFFLGWTKAGGDGTVYYANNAMVMTGHTVMIAQYRAESSRLKLTYHKNLPGSAEEEVKDIIANITLATENEDLFTDSEHILTGWNTKADGTGDHYHFGASLLIGDEDVDLYGIWVRPITIKAESAVKAYDGETLSMASAFVTTESLSLTPGDLLSVTMTAASTITKPGTVYNIIDTYMITRGGADVTHQYRVTKENGLLEITENDAIIIITAMDGDKPYDGKALVKDAFSTSVLPSGITHINAVMEGSQTDVGSSSNYVAEYSLWNGEIELDAEYFPNIKTMYGTLVVTENDTAITITAASDSKPYDGYPLANSGFSFTSLPAGITHVTADVSGSQTDVGSSANIVTGYKLWNGAKDVTAIFTGVTVADGTLEVAVNHIPVTIKAGSAGKYRDGTPLTEDTFITTALPAGITHVTAAVAGSQTEAGSSENQITSYTLWNGSQNVTGFFTNVIREKGLLTVWPAAAIPLSITAGSASKVYDGMPLTNHAYEITGGSLKPGDRIYIKMTAASTIISPGTVANAIDPYDLTILSENGADVTSEYAVAMIYGVLEVTENLAPLTVTAASGSKPYDGYPLVNAVFSHTALPVGVTSVTARTDGLQVNVGSSVNAIAEYRLWNGDKDVTLFFPNVSFGNGFLEVAINPTPIVITAASDSKRRDGFPLTKDAFVVSALPDGITYVTAVVAGSQTEAGSSANEVTAYALWNGDEEVTDFFANVTKVNGLLTVVPANATFIEITAASDSKVYDGLPLKNSIYTITGGGLKSGDVLSAQMTAVSTITAPGIVKNMIDPFSLTITSPGGIDVTDEYLLKKNDGWLEVMVNAAPVTITAESGSKPYDGYPLAKGGFSVSALPDGITDVTARITGYQVNVGASANVVADYQLWNGDKDVTRFFSGFTVANGVLEVTKNNTPITIIAESDSKYRDGTPLTKNAFATSALPAMITHITAAVTGSQTEAGSSDNEITSYRLWNHDKDVTDFFSDVTLAKGLLTVTPANATYLHITAGSSSKIYDGLPLKNDSYLITGGGLKPGDQLSVKMAETSVIVNPGTVYNRIDPFALKITSQSDIDVTSEYMIKMSYGLLTVTAVKGGGDGGGGDNGDGGNGAGGNNENGSVLMPVKPSPPPEVSDQPEAEMFVNSDDQKSKRVVVAKTEVEVGAAPPPVTVSPSDLTVSSADPEPEGSENGVFDHEVSDRDVPVIKIGNLEVPALSTSDPEVWALFSLLLAVLNGILAMVMAIRVFIYKKRNKAENSETNRIRYIWMVSAFVFSILGLFLFMMTQDIDNTMVLADIWTFSHLGILVLEIIAGIFIFKHKDKENISSIR